VGPDQVSLGVLVTALPRDAVDGAVAACGVGAKRSDGKLPPHVTAYLIHADLELKQRALDRPAPPRTKKGRYQPTDDLLAFLEAL
jgi:hypothetical protein